MWVYVPKLLSSFVSWTEITQHHVTEFSWFQSKCRLAAKRWKYKPSVPSVIMGNVNCLTNKTVELAALVRTDRTFRERSLLCLSETWLTQNTPDTNVDVPGFPMVRADMETQRQTQRWGTRTVYEHQMVQPGACYGEGDWVQQRHWVAGGRTQTILHAPRVFPRHSIQFNSVLFI